MTEGSLQEAGSTSEQGSKEEVRLPQEEHDVESHLEKPTVQEEILPVGEATVEEKSENPITVEVEAHDKPKTEKVGTPEVKKEPGEKIADEKPEQGTVEASKSNGNETKVEVHLTESDGSKKEEVATTDGELHEVPLHTQVDTQITISQENADPEHPQANGKVDPPAPTSATSEPKGQEAGSASEQGSKEEVRLPQEEHDVESHLEKPTVQEEILPVGEATVEEKSENPITVEVEAHDKPKTEKVGTPEVKKEPGEKIADEKPEQGTVEASKSNGNETKVEVHLTESDGSKKEEVATTDGELHEVPLHTQVDTQITISQENADPEHPQANGKVDPPAPTSATSEPKEKISCVQVLNAMVFLAFMVNYMLRVNLTIAIVDMIADNETMDNSTIIDEPRFPWNTYQKNLILGCFFWGYVLTELPGGRMSEVFGPRRVYGYSMLIASLVTFFTPYAALNFDYMGVVVLRIIVGFMLGVTFPAMQPIASKWIPPKDRTKFVSNMMASSLGAAVTLPVCGYLISSYGWQSVFYVTGVLGTILAVSWFLFVYDTPSQHPRITREEREYLEREIGASSKVRKQFKNWLPPGSTTDPAFITSFGFPLPHTASLGILLLVFMSWLSRQAPKVPWIALLTSMPVWAIVITHACSVFCYFTFLNQMPTYMKHVLGTDIKKNGILSSFPYVGKYAMALITSYIADYVRAQGKLSTTLVRKSFTTFAVGLPGLLMVAQVYLGYSTFWTVSIFTFALTLNGAVTAGYLGNGLDIAPNYSGTIFGIANTLSSMGGFLSTYVVADITYQNETYERFQIVFWILAATYFAGCIMYLVFGTGELLAWNSVEENKTRDVEMIEKQPLKNDTINQKL